MSEPLDVLRFLDERVLIGHVTAQRWFGAKTQEVAHAAIVESALLRSQEPLLVAALAEIVFPTGTHETYQLLLGIREGAWNDGRIADFDGVTLYDATWDPSLSRELVHLMRSGQTAQTEDGTLEFRPAAAAAALGQELLEARRVESEQSNSSVVFDEELILNAYRRLEAGINPELEILRFLTEHGFQNTASLGGWYAYRGARMEATLGILQQFVSDGIDGWELALDELATAPDRFLGRIRRLGQVTGTMHTILGSVPSDPAFCPEETSAEALGLLTATIDEEIERIFIELPDLPEVEPIAGRGEEVRDQLRLLTHIGTVGRVIRHHGDFHLGQTLLADDDWVILDFEGEPARSLPERRRKRSPLRDVAGMLRSFAYAASAVEILRGVVPPDGWERQARSEFVEGYLETADPNLLPSTREAIDRLLAVFELEKAVYELRYELNNRPAWVVIPVAGIVRLLEVGAAA
jgi:maltokinase